jgi:hypothetical protein
MQSGQFYRGKIDGIQKRFETPEIEKLLPKEKLDELRDYRDIGEYPRFFKKEIVLAKTIVTAADNSDGRRGGVINHTVLYKFEPSVTLDNIKYIFPLEEFITEILAGKRRFKMPPTPQLPEADAGLIDLPPPIEWEVPP